MTRTVKPGASVGSTDEALVQTVGLTRHFRLGGSFSDQVLHAVDDLSLSINEREIVAVVGESGSGKTTLVRLLAMVYRPTRGEIIYRGRSVRALRSRQDVLWYRGEVPMVSQDPYSAMNPVFRVSHGVVRNLKLHRPDLDSRQRWQEAERVFDIVGLTPDMLEKFPYEMSGGQRQRVGFAQALAVQPKLVLADEPVSMLDVSIRAGILNLMMSLREQEGASILYITHDVASARYVADRIIVMYAAHQVESGPAEMVLSNPKHPYTQLLLSAVSDPGEQASLTTSDTGEPPKVINPTEGCRFRWRCPYVIDECSRTTPKLRAVGLGHEAACHVATVGPGGGDQHGKPAAPATPGVGAPG
jgi:oligopeptide/dipeptide ABC transporter ATP-binding protein